MNPDRRYPERVSQRRHSARRPLQSTKALTVKLATLGVVATLGIGGLIAAQMAAGKDPSLGPKASTRAKKTSSSGAKSGSSSGSSTGGSTGSAAATDPYAQSYGGYDGYYGSSSGYSSGSSGSSGSGYSTQQSAPAPVTSSTS